MTDAKQQPLFEEPKDPKDPTVDLSEVAERIGRNATPYEPVDRTSEAAKDQGWGPRAYPDSNDADEAIASVTDIYSKGQKIITRNHPLSLSFVPKSIPEPRYGDSEVDGGTEPNGRDADWKLNKTQRSVGKLGVAFARSELKRYKSKDK
jgi:hypothetical protein